MPTSTTLASFTLATALILVLPGPAVLFVVTRSATLGLRRGLLGTLGVECGSLVHVGAAAAGVSAVLTRSDVAFALVKYAGAAYLCLLGVRQLRGAGTGHAGADGGSASSRAFADGFVVEALNPKTALFFIAFLPQFVDPARGGVAGQVAVLGLVFVVLALVVDSAYALLGASAGAALVRRAGSGLVSRTSGVVHIGLATLAATARSAA